MATLIFNSIELSNLNKLCSTLDARYFYLLPQSKQKSLADISLKIIKSPWLNPTINWSSSIPLSKRVRLPRANLALAYIIYKSFYPDPFFKPIVGLKDSWEVSVWESKKYDMKVLFLSDPHYESKLRYPTGYSSVMDFILSEITASNAPIDLFLEYSYKSESTINAGEGPLAFLKVRLHDCFKSDKSKCPYYNLRAHLVDMRTANFASIFNIIDILASSCFDKYLADHVIAEIDKPEIKNILKNRQSIKNFILQSITTGRIGKSFNSIADALVKDVLMNHLRTWLNADYEKEGGLSMAYLEYETFRNNMMGFRNSSYEDQYTKEQAEFFCNIQAQSFYEYFGLLMDAYLLSRLFRTYKADKKNDFYFSGRARNAIVFTGGTHVEKYKEILTALNFTNTFMSRTENNKSKLKALGEQYEQKISQSLKELKQPIFQIQAQESRSLLHKASMPTKAVSIKVANLRKIGYTDLDQWMANPDNVYVGRAGRIFIHEPNGSKRVFHYKENKWCNPFKLGEYDLKTSLDLYKRHLESSGLINDIEELRGKNLGCFCEQQKDQSGNPLCHAQVLVDILEK